MTTIERSVELLMIPWLILSLLSGLSQLSHCACFMLKIKQHSSFPFLFYENGFFIIDVKC